MSEKKKKKDSYVTLIDDPFGIRTPEINEAQNNAEELDLDQDIISSPEMAEAEEGETQEKLENIARAIDAATEEETAKLEALDTASTLAEQIAEDQALAKELAEQQEKAEAAEKDPELQAALPQADADGNLDLLELESCLEALLFMFDKPVSLQKLREMIGPDFKLSLFQEAMTALRDRYKASNHGIEVIEVAGGFQFRTKPGRAALARKLAKVQAHRLSSGAMESLAIIAYRQPVMKEDIDKIRGVDSSYFIYGLLEKNLIRIVGRSELPGKPMLYGTSDAFLELFGLKDLSSMPSLRELESMIPNSETANPNDEDPRVKEMRRLVSEMKADKSGALNYDPKEDEKILKEIKEKVGAIPISTPYLEEQKALEKQAAQPAAETPAQ